MGVILWAGNPSSYARSAAIVAQFTELVRCSYGASYELSEDPSATYGQ